MVESGKNICLLCSLGCGVIVEVERDEAVNLEYDTENPVNKGKLCARGNYILELINHPLRLNVPEKEGQAVRWEQAATEIADAVRAARDKKAAAVVISGDASCEDVGLAVAFAANCTGAGDVAMSFPTCDDEVISALAGTAAGVPQATLDDLEKSVCTIAVGDPFARCPVIAGRMLAARNAARANSLNVVSREGNMTSRFAATHLQGGVRESMLDLVAAVIEASGGAKKSWQKRLVEGVDASGDARGLAKSFVDSEESVIVLSTGDPVVAQLANALVKAAGDNKRLFALHDYGNARDIMGMFTGGVLVEDVIESAGKGEIDVLLVLGADLVTSYPNLDLSGALSKVPLLVAGAPFANQTAALAGMVLPAALWIETDGTFSGAMRQRVIDAPGGAMSYGDILKMVGKAMGVELHAPEPAEVLKEEALTEDRAGEIAKAAREEAAPWPVESTAISFGDGSLTGGMSWVKMVERVS